MQNILDLKEKKFNDQILRIQQLEDEFVQLRIKKDHYIKQNLIDPNNNHDHEHSYLNTSNLTIPSYINKTN
jgi:hypothetical protein